MRAAGAVIHSFGAVLAVALRPPRRGRNRDLKPFRGPAQTPALINDTVRELQPAARGQKSVRVGHEDLRAWNWTLDKPHSTRSSCSCHQTTPSVTNVRGQYA
ncbi:hypothetical protein ARGLB_077_00390 [Arthrobacter globiformis NBRC 12137]|uniref:Uncharacterized protein n=1 Tax=Arthrobacter globiformis (strain ATCC 8010 / DSM 20124 / JCM 1332 / NBRC 12137 / NCIMB 8907 / NRRL B-2979 / 168) TaxID=1077972 RepID=H0QPS1_ARTG1|nr:hypothetical protein ARGLB_077_00390 [Arthrobacter globiformis NBRC 12137]